MPKLYSSQYIQKILEREGFVFVSQKGSHAKFRKVKNGTALTVILPMAKKEIPLGTFRSILKQSYLQETHFNK